MNRNIVLDTVSRPGFEYPSNVSHTINLSNINKSSGNLAFFRTANNIKSLNFKNGYEHSVPLGFESNWNHLLLNFKARQTPFTNFTHSRIYRLNPQSFWISLKIAYSPFVKMVNPISIHYWHRQHLVSLHLALIFLHAL